MSNTQQLTGEPNGQIFTERALMTGAANKAVTQLEEHATRGAAAVSRMAHRAADHVDQTASYLQEAGRRTWNAAKDKSRGVRDSVSNNPIPMILGAAAVGVGIGYFLHRKRW
jgi:ElaB/YqjD/DUF883 family membrane-anchored ribosome-binding protein